MVKNAISRPASMVTSWKPLPPRFARDEDVQVAVVVAVSLDAVEPAKLPEQAGRPRAVLEGAIAPVAVEGHGLCRVHRRDDDVEQTVDPHEMGDVPELADAGRALAEMVQRN